MSTLVLKLCLTPALIGGVTLAQRQWGSRASGLLVGLPLTSGPVAFYLALDHGDRFARASATGTIAGLASEAAFCLVYARVAAGAPWPASLVSACLAFFAGTVLLRAVPDVLVPTYAGVLAVLTLTRSLVSSAEASPAPTVRTSWWDLPGRMLTATAFVIALTASADALGPRLSGLLSPLPIYAAVLAVFTHHLQGAAAAQRFLHGVLTGLFAFATFFLVLAVALVHQARGPAFLEATAVALAVQAMAVVLARRRGDAARARTFQGGFEGR